jgi:ABC-type Zn2+ transport system substrate-binding protein/surface adhesin
MRRIYPECQFCALEDFLTAGTLLRQEGEDEEDEEEDERKKEEEEDDDETEDGYSE